jgi:hypothetical protein
MSPGDSLGRERPNARLSATALAPAATVDMPMRSTEPENTGWPASRATPQEIASAGITTAPSPSSRMPLATSRSVSDRGAMAWRLMVASWVETPSTAAVVSAA